MSHYKILFILLLLLFASWILVGANAKEIKIDDVNNKSPKTDCLIPTDKNCDILSFSRSNCKSLSELKLNNTEKKAQDSSSQKEESCETAVTSTETEEKYYPLSEHERDKIERVIMASCGDFSLEMTKANAQVILDRLQSKKFGNSVDEVLDAPKQFEKPSQATPNSKVKQAVSEVFDKGERVSKTKLYYYVNPNYSYVSKSDWKKGKTYVMTVGNGKFIHEYWTDT